MNTQIINTNSLATKQFVVGAGLYGLTFPRPTGVTLTDVDRRRMRMDDLVDKAFWDDWVNKCMARYVIIYINIYVYTYRFYIG